MLVFALNIVLGLACSLGFNMGYNNNHHKDEVAQTPVHVHADGKKHLHNKAPDKSHHTGSVANHHDKEEGAKKDDCCSDEVVQFQKSDKCLHAKIGVSMPVLVAAISVFWGIQIFETVPLPSLKYTARYFHPPPPDIRTAIQSFQI